MTRDPRSSRPPNRLHAPEHCMRRAHSASGGLLRPSRAPGARAPCAVAARGRPFIHVNGPKKLAQNASGADPKCHRVQHALVYAARAAEDRVEVVAEAGSRTTMVPGPGRELRKAALGGLHELAVA